MKKRVVATAALLVVASAALAHQNVKNPAVMTRMNAMSAIGDHMKVLGDMARGKTEFDHAVARNAAAGISGYSARIPGLFEAPESDPKSEALAAIWEDFGDFTAKSDDLTGVAAALSETISRREDLASAVARLGQTCKACHSVYRE